MSCYPNCLVCGAPRSKRQPEFDLHQRSARHVEAVQKWDEDHGAFGKQVMTRHDFHVWLRIGCGQLAEPAAA